ncbi:hypothetical protein DV737_g442, partial [Chaetothyriales sp. CBS 132003]
MRMGRRGSATYSARARGLRAGQPAGSEPAVSYRRGDQPAPNAWPTSSQQAANKQPTSSQQAANKQQAAVQPAPRDLIAFAPATWPAHCAISTVTSAAVDAHAHADAHNAGCAHTLAHACTRLIRTSDNPPQLGVHATGAPDRAVSQQPAAAALQPAALSHPRVPRFDDLYEYYDPQAEARPQRQQAAQSTAAPSPPPPPPSASTSTRSPGAASLRRTRRLRTPPAAAATATAASPPAGRQPVRGQSPDRGLLFQQSGSTSAQSFQRLVDDDSYWPQRTPYVSRRTHDAILFALEAIRTGRGVGAHPLTPDPIEERARMSDLLRDNGPSGTPLGRAQNGSGQLAQEPPRMRTPRDGRDTGRPPGPSRLEPAGPSRSYNISGPVPQAVPLPGRQPDTAALQPQQTAFEPSHARAGASQPRTGSRFPHAFERWEQLSAQWEGLTSHWLRRLQNNTNELEAKPLEQQMARQIADLSAAGANLFHAVVELQRLRASSERKDARLTAQAAGTDAAVRAEKARAEDMVREMRRELQISKEEARRAWEELGRREQEERERTIALRSGEPTLIGGVQVVPMQGIPSRQPTSVGASQRRPSTAEAGATARPPSRTTSTSLDSPGEEARQFTYQPQPPSSASTDPFSAEASAAQQPGLSREQLDPEFYASRAANLPEEYHINPDGSYTLDSSGRRIPYNQPLAQEFSVETEAIGEESDDDYASDIAREQAYAQEYASPTRRPGPPFPPQHQQQQTSPPGVPSTPPQHASASRLPPGSVPYVSSSQAASTPTAYLSAEQGGPSTPHPTRLSDIIEEQTSRTSPSRGSYISGSAAGGPHR